MKTCICPKCKKELHINEDGRDFFFCEYCGEKIQLEKEDSVIEEMMEMEEDNPQLKKASMVFFAITLAAMAIGILGERISGNKIFYIFVGFGIVVGEMGLLSLRTKKSGPRFSVMQEKIFEDLKKGK